MTVKNFLELLETPLYYIDVDLYFGNDCEGAMSIPADKLITSEYADRQIIGWDFGESMLSITINK